MSAMLSALNHCSMLKEIFKVLSRHNWSLDLKIEIILARHIVLYSSSHAIFLRHSWSLAYLWDMYKQVYPLCSPPTKYCFRTLYWL